MSALQVFHILEISAGRMRFSIFSSWLSERRIRRLSVRAKWVSLYFLERLCSFYPLVLHCSFHFVSESSPSFTLHLLLLHKHTILSQTPYIKCLIGRGRDDGRAELSWQIPINVDLVGGGGRDWIRWRLDLFHRHLVLSSLVRTKAIHYWKAHGLVHMLRILSGVVWILEMRRDAWALPFRSGRQRLHGGDSRNLERGTLLRVEIIGSCV